MATPLLIDTDVLIDYLRGYPAAVSYVEAQQERFLISVVTVAELYAGVREGEERARLEQFLRAFEIIPLDLRLAVQGGLYRRDYRKSHNVGLADAAHRCDGDPAAGSARDTQPETFSHASGCHCAVPEDAAQCRT
jgi:predicted nucleic acid-binding protein